jgi:hypothetical protein
MGSLHCGYYVCEHLRICGTYKVHREDVSHHYKYYVCEHLSISILIIRRNGIIHLNMTCKEVEWAIL